MCRGKRLTLRGILVRQSMELRTLVSTMAGGPQVVTFCLDELLHRDIALKEVIVLHLSPRADPQTGQALTKLTAEFPGGFYTGPTGKSKIRLQFYPIRSGDQILDDIQDERAAQAAWHAIYGLIGDLKAQGHALEVCISGGRRMLALQALSAAMLHFDHWDRLWHMYTPPAFLARAADGAIMHARPEDGVRLIQVPMMAWGAYLPTLRSLAQPAWPAGMPDDASSPTAVLAAHGQLIDPEERKRCLRVIESLTPRQRETLHAFAQGGSPQDVAEALTITLKTVDSHKTAILAECRIAWALSPDAWLDYHWLRERFGWFLRDELYLP